MALVSVIIPTHNRAEKVVRAVRSVLEQTFGDFELVVVDDASTDDTPQALAPYLDRITYLVNEKRMGVAASRNRGIRQSSGPLVAFLDSDDYWLPRKLEVQVGFFRKHDSTVACQTQEIWIRKGTRVNPKKKHRKPSGDIFLPSLGLCLVSPSAVMIKRQVLYEVGLFDETLPVCEDYDLWLRISARYPIELIPEPLLVKEGGAPDQLSAAFWGMDRFRIRSLMKLLLFWRLDRKKQRAVAAELRKKCHIYAQGCRKRGKKEEAGLYESIPNLFEAQEPEKGQEKLAQALEIYNEINKLQAAQTKPYFR